MNVIGFSRPKIAPPSAKGAILCVALLMKRFLFQSFCTKTAELGDLMMFLCPAMRFVLYVVQVVIGRVPQGRAESERVQALLNLSGGAPYVVLLLTLFPRRLECVPMGDRR